MLPITALAQWGISVKRKYLGAELIKRQTALGFGAITCHGSYEAMRDKILAESKRVFRPEFLDRLDDIIVSHQLERHDLVKIVDLELLGRLIPINLTGDYTWQPNHCISQGRFRPLRPIGVPIAHAAAVS